MKSDIDILSEYPDFVDNTNVTLPDYEDLQEIREDTQHHLLGLSEEVGELCSIYVKTQYTDKIDYNYDDWVGELGDILYHLQALCNGIDLTIPELMKLNMEKLNKRNNVNE